MNPEDLVGDAFKILTIDLTGLTSGGLAIDQSISFYQDTDPAIIPEPGTLAFIGLAGFALALARYRRPA